MKVARVTETKKEGETKSMMNHTMPIVIFSAKITSIPRKFQPRLNSLMRFDAWTKCRTRHIAVHLALFLCASHGREPFCTLSLGTTRCSIDLEDGLNNRVRP